MILGNRSVAHLHMGEHRSQRNQHIRGIQVIPTVTSSDSEGDGTVEAETAYSTTLLLLCVLPKPVEMINSAAPMFSYSPGQSFW